MSQAAKCLSQKNISTPPSRGKILNKNLFSLKEERTSRLEPLFERSCGIDLYLTQKYAHYTTDRTGGAGRDAWRRSQQT